MFRIGPLLGLALCSAVVLFAEPCCAAEKLTSEQKIEQALGKPISMEFVETPLQDVADFIADTHEINVVVDTKSLDDIGVGTDTPVTSRIKNISLRSALTLVLDGLDLSWTVRHEVLLITSKERAETTLAAKVYPVKDLLVGGTDEDKDDDEGREHYDYDRLIDVITSTVAPATWDEVGGPGSIAAGSFNSAEVLVVSQTYQVHAQIARLLEDLRAEAQKGRVESKPPRKK